MNWRKVEGSMLVMVDGEEVMVELSARYYPGTRDVYYLSNGDPGYPGDPAEVDEILATYEGEDVDLTEEQLKKAEEILLEKGGEGE